MPERISRKLFEAQLKCGVLGEEDRSLYEYGYQLLIGKLLVYVLILVMGIWTGSLLQIFVFLLAFTPIRQYAGGFHLEKAGACIWASGFLVCAAGQYLRFVPVPGIGTMLLWGVSIGIIWALAPVGCSNKRLDEKETEVYRRRTRILLGLESIVTGIAFAAGYLWISKGVMLAQILLAAGLVAWRWKQTA